MAVELPTPEYEQAREDPSLCALIRSTIDSMVKHDERLRAFIPIFM